MKSRACAATPLSEAVRFALLQQALVLLLSAGMLDGGQLAQVCLYAFAGFWSGAGVLIARRGPALTRLDILLIRWSSIPLCVLSYFLTHWIWRLRGY